MERKTEDINTKRENIRKSLAFLRKTLNEELKRYYKAQELNPKLPIVNLDIFEMIDRKFALIFHHMREPSSLPLDSEVSEVQTLTQKFIDDLKEKLKI